MMLNVNRLKIQSKEEENVIALYNRFMESNKNLYNYIYN